MPQYVPREIKARRRSLHPESKQQRSCVYWFRLQYPQYKRLLFAIPNGGKRTKAEAGILQAEGVVPGIPDLQLAVPRHGYHGMFIEMKFGDNTLSESQVDCIADLRQQGYYVVECYTFEEFVQFITDYLQDNGKSNTQGDY